MFIAFAESDPCCSSFAPKSSKQETEKEIASDREIERERKTRRDTHRERKRIESD